MTKIHCKNYGKDSPRIFASKDSLPFYGQRFTTGKDSPAFTGRFLRFLRKRSGNKPVSRFLTLGKGNRKRPTWGKAATVNIDRFRRFRHSVLVNMVTFFRSCI